MVHQPIQEGIQWIAVNLESYSVFSKIELSKIVRKDDEVVIYCGGKT
jgi:hypothetical protein